VPFADLPETRLAIAQFLGAFNPGHIYDVVRYFRETKPGARLETLVAVLELTLWDPVVFDQFFDVLLASLPYAGSYGIEKLAENLHRVADNFFYLPSATDTYRQIGVLLQEMRRYTEALQAYEASLSWYGESARTFYNMGLCHRALQQPQEAVSWFREALRLRPGFIEARGWIAQIEHDREESPPARAPCA
jgi:tetratricopeptide (TPR) repeat protein